MLDVLEDHAKVKKLIAQGSIVNIESLLDKVNLQTLNPQLF